MRTFIYFFNKLFSSVTMFMQRNERHERHEKYRCNILTSNHSPSRGSSKRKLLKILGIQLSSLFGSKQPTSVLAVSILRCSIFKYESVAGVFFVFTFYFANMTAYAAVPDGAQVFQRSAGSGLSEYNSTLTRSKYRVGKSYALIVGIYDYVHWDDFSWGNADLQRMKKMLLDDQGFDQVIVLEQEYVTTESVSEAVRYFSEKITTQDRFLFYFSGHGVDVDNNQGGKTGLLPLVDSHKSLGIEDNAISMNSISHWFNEVSKANHTLFMLDSCFSGLAGGIEIKGAPTSKEYRLERLLNRGHYLITAGAHNQTSIGGPAWNGSLFTSLIAQGMAGAADVIKQDGIVSFGELFLYTKNEIDDALAKIAQDQFADGFGEKYEMTPVRVSMGAYKSVGEFFFIPKQSELILAFSEVDAKSIEVKGLTVTERINYQDEYLRSKEKSTGNYFTIVGSFKNYRSARDYARDIRERHPDIYAVVYDRYKDNEYFGIMMAAFVSKDKAIEAKNIAIKRGIATDAYVWELPVE